MKLKRCYDECRPCNILRHVADIPFGLEGKYTVGLRRLAVCAGTDDSFKKASENLERYTGIKLSRETIRELCQQEAPKIEQWQATSPEACADFIASHGAVEVMIDGTCVNTMEGWRETKILTVTTRPFGEGVLPEQWDKRKLPHTNVRFASAGVEDKEAFHKRLSFCRSRLRLGTNGDISVLADGAPWIWDLSQVEFGKPRECLDIYHALKHLSGVGTVLYGTGTEAYTKWQEETKLELLSDGFVLLEQRLNRLDAEELPPLAKESIRLLRGYLENNRERLCYRERLSEGRAIGTGQVEGACKNMIGRRLKQTGARWQVPRLNRMAILCALRYGDQWDNYWKHAT